MRNKSKFALSSSPVRQAQGRLWRGSIHLVLALVLLLLLACGDTTTEVVTQTVPNNIEIVDEESVLPECTEDNEGEQVLVKGENVARTCIDGDWTAAFTSGRDTVYLKSKDISCYTAELADKQGVKVICDGDSVGVLHNGGAGAKGDKGDAGTGCSLVPLDSVTMRLFCGDDSITVYLKAKTDTSLNIDAERIPVTLDSLTGIVQKGPFLKGGTVTLYELHDGSTLEKTGKFYLTEILDDNGNYKFPKMELASQYALISAKGYYLNEVTGEKSSEPVELNALVNLLERKTVNINVLTHLEVDRVNYLVVHKGTLFSQAKKQARSEILKEIRVGESDVGNFETLDVFAKVEDGSTALLALSVLLLIDSGEKNLLESLQKIINDVNNGTEVGATFWAHVADGTADADLAWQFDAIRKNLEKWKTSKTVLDFEKLLRAFWHQELGVGACSAAREGEVVAVSNENSAKFGTTFRFICRSGYWHEALDIEKDTYGIPCTPERQSTTMRGLVIPTNNYFCSENEWGLLWNWDVSKENFLNPRIKYDIMVDERDRKAYRIVKVGGQVWMAENLNYSDSIKMPDLGVCYDDIAKNCELIGRLYDENSVNDVCPNGWHLPDTTEWNTLFDAVGGAASAGRMLKSIGGWVYFNLLTERGVDSVGFAVLPTVFRSNWPSEALFWSATKYTGENDSLLDHSHYVFFSTGDRVSFKITSEQVRYSVRCIQD